MLVETYEVEEATSEAAAMAADSEAAEIIAKLELTGQQKLLNPDTVTRFPYRKMTKQEGLVYAILCPVKSKLRDYSDGIIPVRVLQVAAHVSDLGFCNRVEVWHPESADIKDPVLVGVNGPEYGDQELYILARWGAELPPFSELLTLATKMWREKRKTALAAIQGEIAAELSSGATSEKLGAMPYYAAGF
jgi:hypothetical protein